MLDNQLNRQAFQIEKLIKRAEKAEFTFEYNCHLHRIYPWDDLADTKKPTTEFGLIWVVVDEKTEIDGHSHDEEETFVVISGKALIDLEGQQCELTPGDTVYIPRGWHHVMKNPFDTKLVYVDLYWGFGQGCELGENN